MTPTKPTEASVLQGVLLSIFGQGVLITGESGVGKSELALAMIDRGHRLVCDDVPEVQTTPEGHLVGRCPTNIQDLMEVRGLGVLNVRQLLGEKTIQAEQKIDLLIHLRNDAHPPNRLELAQTTTTVLGTALPTVTLPVRSHRPIPLLIEMVVRQRQLLQNQPASEHPHDC